MCGIVGLLVKNPALRDQLGALMVPMLVGMTERGPDSAGLAVYTAPVSERRHKLSLYSGESEVDWSELLARIAADFCAAAHEISRARQSRGADQRGRSGFARCMARAQRADDRRALGGPIDRSVQGRGRAGGHRRAVRFQVAAWLAPGGPYPHGDRIGRDAGACASVHRGTRFLPGAQWLAVQSAPGAQALWSRSASNSRRTTTPRPRAVSSSGGCARATIWKRRCSAASASSTDSTRFLMGTDQELLIVRDAFACKPAVVAETDDYVAIASEFRSLAHLPRISHAIAVRAQAGGDLFMANLRPLPEGCASSISPASSLRDLNLYLHKQAGRRRAYRKFRCEIPTVRIPSRAASTPISTCRYMGTSAITWRE